MMLEPWAIGAMAIGGSLMIAAFVHVWRKWATVRIPPASVILFYVGAIVVVIGLQPIRPFAVQYAEAYMLPPGDEARTMLVENLASDDWVVGAAKPNRYVSKDNPLQPEIAERFEIYRSQHDLLTRQPCPDFLFVGRKADGWSRNPHTSTWTFLFLGFVFCVATSRYAVRLMSPPRA